MADVVPTLFSFEIAQTWSIYTIPDSGLKAPSTGHCRGGIPPEQNTAVLNDGAKVR